MKVSLQRLTLFVGLIPFAPFLAAVLAYAPLVAPGVVPLVGTWHVFDDDTPIEAITAEDIISDDHTVSLPGSLPPRQTLLKIARTFRLDTTPTGPFGLVFGGVSNGVADIWLNGRWLGAEGVVDVGYKLSHVGLGYYAINTDQLRAGDNTLVIAIFPEGQWQTQPRTAVVDHRLLVGPQRLVRPWYDSVSILEHVLELGGAFLLVFVMVLMVGLSIAERDRLARQIQWAAAGLCLAIALYLAGKSGMTRVIGMQREIIPMAVTCIALLLPELLERAFAGRTTRFQTVNRVICISHIGIQLVMVHAIVYVAFIPWLFIVMLRGLWLAAGALRRNLTAESVLLVGSVVAMVAAGMNDLITDLNLFATPRLFTLAAVDMAIIGSIFVVGRFLRTMTENTRLIADVERQNLALTTALDRAEESTKLKSAFLANTSHELRTPLNSIINVPEGLLEEFVQRPFIACSACGSLFEAPEGYALTPSEACPECAATGVLSVELRAVFSGDPDAAMRYLRSIQQSGRHLLAVVNDILDFSKLEVGRMVVHLEDVAINDVFERVELAMLPLAEARRVSLVVKRADGDVHVDGDALKLTQVLMNLLSNALKFSPEGGEVDVNVVATDDDVVLSVMDGGIGIAPEDQDRIFESFMQLDNSHTRKVGGTGLGLAITKKLVELMHGTLTLKSTVGVGSTFSVTLPRRSGNAPTASETSTTTSTSTDSVPSAAG